MATYIVGDLHGCLSALLSLLDEVNFDSSVDKLWLTGDLVARGPDSLGVLRFIKGLGLSAQTVLGNHDLHLLAIAQGIHSDKPKDNLKQILNAPDRDELLHWLRAQPLFVEHPEHNFALSHAGIPPIWGIKETLYQAQKVHESLIGKHYSKLLNQMYDDTLNQWSEHLSKREQCVYTINALTRMRFCYLDGTLELTDKSEPCKVTYLNQAKELKTTWKHTDNDDIIPWFSISKRLLPLEKVVIFGHWASLLGYKSSEFIGLDTGYIWGHSLTMLRWEDQKYFIRRAF